MSDARPEDPNAALAWMWGQYVWVPLTWRIDRRWGLHSAIARAMKAWLEGHVQSIVAAAAALALVGGPGAAAAQPLAGASAARVGPSYLYPDPRVTPGAVNPAVTEANIQQTICTQGWTATIRPPATYTSALKVRQLAAAHAKDPNPTHYEEDHYISLELGGHPTAPGNLWPEQWGTPAHPLTARGPFRSHLVGAKSKDAVENALHREVCAGTLTLREARAIIAGDWFKYYRDHLLH